MILEEEAGKYELVVKLEDESVNDEEVLPDDGVTVLDITVLLGAHWFPTQMRTHANP